MPETRAAPRRFEKPTPNHPYVDGASDMASEPSLQLLQERVLQ